MVVGVGVLVFAVRKLSRVRYFDNTAPIHEKSPTYEATGSVVAVGIVLVIATFGLLVGQPRTKNEYLGVGLALLISVLSVVASIATMTTKKITLSDGPPQIRSHRNDSGGRSMFRVETTVTRTANADDWYAIRCWLFAVCILLGTILAYLLAS